MIAIIDKIIGRVAEKNRRTLTSCAHANPHRIHDEGSSFSSKRIKGKTIERIAKDDVGDPSVGVRDQFGCLSTENLADKYAKQLRKRILRMSTLSAAFSQDLTSPFSRLLSRPSHLPRLFVKRAKCHFPARSKPEIVSRLPLYVRQQG